MGNVSAEMMHCERGYVDLMFFWVIYIIPAATVILQLDGYSDVPGKKRT